jgi:hypothetical protein
LFEAFDPKKSCGHYARSIPPRRQSRCRAGPEIG